jgi:hypothetical protein
VDRFDEEQLIEGGDRRRAQRRERPAMARYVAVAMVIAFVIATASKAIPA